VAAVKALLRVGLIVLAVAFLAGAWEARRPPLDPLADERPPTKDDPVLLAHDHPTPPRLVAVRRGRHATYDRILFEFRGGVPRTSVRYVPTLPRTRAGAPVELAGDANLLVVFGATARTAAGRPSFSGPARARPLWPALHEYALISEAGGQVTFGLGVDRRLGFRVIERSRPARVVVDVAN
jgi:hypothetical protein